MSMWKKWLGELTSSQLSSLKTELGMSNNSSDISIVRTPIEDFMYTSTPPYVDVFNLMPLYHKLMFNENLLVRGPKGDGKSLSLIALAASTGTPLVTVPCSEDIKKKDLIGSFFFKGNETPFMLGSMATAIDIANECGRAIIAFEEVNALTPQTQKQLNEFLDFRKSVSIPQAGKTYRLKETAQVWAVGLMNPSLYGGTYDLNEDFRSRWVEVEIGYPTQAQEKVILEANVPIPIGMDVAIYDALIQGCTMLASETREKRNSLSYALSTRDVVKLLKTILLLGTEAALQLLFHKFEGKDKETIAARLSSSFAGFKAKEKWNSAKAAV